MCWPDPGLYHDRGYFRMFELLLAECGPHLRVQRNHLTELMVPEQHVAVRLMYNSFILLFVYSVTVHALSYKRLMQKQSSDWSDQLI